MNNAEYTNINFSASVEIENNRIYSGDRFFGEIIKKKEKLDHVAPGNSNKPQTYYTIFNGSKYLSESGKWVEYALAKVFDFKKDIKLWLENYFTGTPTPELNLFPEFTVGTESEQPPPKLRTDHWQKVIDEFLADGIPAEVTRSCVDVYPQGDETLAKRLLKRKLKADGSITEAERTYWKNYFDGGWCARNSSLDGSLNDFTCAKLNNPTIDKDKNEPRKYENPTGIKTTSENNYYFLPNFNDKDVLGYLIQGIIDKNNLSLKAEDFNSYAEFFNEAKKHTEIQATEGFKKTVKSIYEGILCFGFTSTTTWGYKENGESVTDNEGFKKLHPQIKKLLSGAVGIILNFDSDKSRTTIKNVTEQCNALAYAISSELGISVERRVWDYKLGKGIDDLFANGYDLDNTQLIEIDTENYRLAKSTRTQKQQQQQQQQNKKPPSSDEMAGIIKQLNPDLSYCHELKSFMVYGDEKEGMWSPLEDVFIYRQIDQWLLQNEKTNYSDSYLKSATEILKLRVLVKKWPGHKNLIPFKDGVLDIKTNKFLAHSKENYLLWQLPRTYNVVEKNWSSIDNWLNEATSGNGLAKKQILAFLAATLRQRSDLQQFLHLIGTGGSGKSTLTSLAMALVGEENTIALSFEDLTQRDAVADLFGKTLVLFPDQETCPKASQEIFKRLTGEDPLRGRRLFKDGFQFKFGGMSIVTSNKPTFTGGSLRWLTRRQVALAFNNPPKKTRNLMREFEPELSAFTSFLLSLPEQFIENALKGDIDGIEFSNVLWASQVEADGLTSWINDHIIYDTESITHIGSNSNEWANLKEYQPELSSLYGSYAVYCRSTNRSQVTLVKFSSQLLEILNQLKFDSVKGKNRNGAFISNIRLRRQSTDFDKPTIEELLNESVMGLISSQNSESLAVTDCDGLNPSVTGSVTAESSAVTDCDGCDGLNDNIAREKMDDKKLDMVNQINTNPPPPSPHPPLIRGVGGMEGYEGCCVEELTSKNETENVKNIKSGNNPSHPSQPYEAKVSPITPTHHNPSHHQKNQQKLMHY